MRWTEGRNSLPGVAFLTAVALAEEVAKTVDCDLGPLPPLTKRLDSSAHPAMVFAMATLAEIETLALRLPESDRARLAADLLDSLPGVLVEDDDGLAEALRRSEEMDRDPAACLTHEEFLKAVGRPA